MNTDAVKAIHQSRQDDRVTNAPISPSIVIATILMWAWKFVVVMFVLNIAVTILLNW